MIRRTNEISCWNWEILLQRQVCEDHKALKAIQIGKVCYWNTYSPWDQSWLSRTRTKKNTFWKNSTALSPFHWANELHSLTQPAHPSANRKCWTITVLSFLADDGKLCYPACDLAKWISTLCAAHWSPVFVRKPVHVTPKLVIINTAYDERDVKRAFIKGLWLIFKTHRAAEDPSAYLDFPSLPSAINTVGHIRLAYQTETNRGLNTHAIWSTPLRRESVQNWGQ